MVRDTWKYMHNLSDSHRDAEKRVDRDIKGRIKIMRNNIPEDIISKEFLNFMIFSILSDQKQGGCKDKLTGGYKMMDNEKHRKDDMNKNFPTIWNNIPSVWLENNGMKEWENIMILRKWFEKKKNQRSYVRSNGFKNVEKFENDFKQKIEKHDLRDVVLNDIFELAIGDLIEDLFKEKMFNQHKLIQDIKVHKTSHYDDVMAKTDFVVEFEYGDHKQYSAYDFTTSHDMANLKRKEELEGVYCREFAYNNGIKGKIPRNLIIVNDMQIVFNYLNDYVKYMLANDGNVGPGDALKVFEKMKIFGSTHDIEKVKKNIREQLLSAAA